MIAFLPLWILGIPLVLSLVDLAATRSGAHEVDYDTSATGRYTGTHDELRRRDVASATTAVGTAQREHPAVNVS